MCSACSAPRSGAPRSSAWRASRNSRPRSRSGRRALADWRKRCPRSCRPPKSGQRIEDRLPAALERAGASAPASGRASPSGGPSPLPRRGSLLRAWPGSSILREFPRLGRRSSRRSMSNRDSRDFFAAANPADGTVTVVPAALLDRRPAAILRALGHPARRQAAFAWPGRSQASGEGGGAAGAAAACQRRFDARDLPRAGWRLADRPADRPGDRQRQARELVVAPSAAFASAPLDGEGGDRLCRDPGGVMRAVEASVAIPRPTSPRGGGMRLLR